MSTGYERIAISLIDTNTGQIAGLPANPRQWTRTDLDSLKKSILETPELLEARGCIVIEESGRYVVLGGNMRLAACRELGMKDVPCYILPESTPAEKLKEIVVKDNGSFGAWDFDMLANEWGDLDLVGWGVSIPPEWGAAAADAAETDSRGGKRRMTNSMRRRSKLKRNAPRATFGGLENTGSCVATRQTRLR